jgi:hypothetical protein
VPALLPTTNRLRVAEAVEIHLVGAIDAAGELGRVIGAPGFVPGFVDRDSRFAANLVACAYVIEHTLEIGIETFDFADQVESDARHVENVVLDLQMTVASGLGDAGREGNEFGE